MIFLAYNYSKYKINNEKNINFKKFVFDKLETFFPNEDYLLPYSQYNIPELAKKLKCNTSEIKGSFIQDLPLMISKCDKLVFFATESLYIGYGVYLEIVCATRYKLPIYCYNRSLDNFTQNFTLESTDFSFDQGLNSMFHKKIKFI